MKILTYLAYIDYFDICIADKLRVDKREWNFAGFFRKSNDVIQIY